MEGLLASSSEEIWYGDGAEECRLFAPASSPPWHGPLPIAAPLGIRGPHPGATENARTSRRLMCGHGPCVEATRLLPLVHSSVSGLVWSGTTRGPAARGLFSSSPERRSAPGHRGWRYGLLPAPVRERRMGDSQMITDSPRVVGSRGSIRMPSAADGRGLLHSRGHGARDHSSRHSAGDRKSEKFLVASGGGAEGGKNHDTVLPRATDRGQDLAIDVSVWQAPQAPVVQIAPWQEKTATCPHPR